MKDLLFKDWNNGKDISLLLIRVVFAFVLLYGHGFEKLGVMFSGQEPQFFDPIGIGANTSFYLAAFAEGICAILILLGAFTRVAAFALIINFLVITYVHSGDGFGMLEMRFMYLFTFVALLIAGAGKFSVDSILAKRNS